MLEKHMQKSHMKIYSWFEQNKKNLIGAAWMQVLFVLMQVSYQDLVSADTKY